MEEKLRKLRKMKKLTKVLFGRTAFVILAILSQIALIFLVTNTLADNSELGYGIYMLFGLVTAIYIFNEDIDSGFKLSWLMPVLLAPAFGATIYLLVNLQSETKRNRRRFESIDYELSLERDCDNTLIEKLDKESHGEKGLAKYLINKGNYPVYEDNGVKFFELGERKFEEMKIQLKRASKFIFMEYFIVDEGKMWTEILDILKEKAKDGVEVRFMYDGMNSLANLPYGYYKDLEKMGIKSRAFERIRPVLSTAQNNRDHRKILVIDGKVAFTGGINLADEYINEITRFGHWKDTAIMVQGDAVRTFTYMFLEMWYVADKKSEVPKHELYKYVCNKEDITFDSDINVGGYVVPYGDNPYSKNRIGKQIYIDILNRARKYVHIMTPYLILDDEMKAALTYCAARGVETVIIMPYIPDKIYAYLLARTYYKELVEKGVKIYEYEPGFVHAKVFVSDDIRAVVGTTNLDYRSLYLHFECGLYVYNNREIHKIEKIIRIH